MQVFKRLLSLFTVLLLLFAALPSALAHDAADCIRITVPEVRAEKDKSVTVSIYVDNARDMDSLQFRVNYDLATLKLTKAEIGEALNNDGLYVINTDEEGLVAMAYANAHGLTQDGGEVLVLTFSQYNDHGSALVVSAAYTSRYDETTGVQTKTYVEVTDGGVYVGENGTVPAGVTTPWPVETPVPTPSPTPEPTPVPTPTPSPTPVPTPEPTPKTFGTVVSDWFSSVRAQMDATAKQGFSFEMLVPILLLVIALIVVVLAIVLIVSGHKKPKDKDDGKDE